MKERAKLAFKQKTTVDENQAATNEVLKFEQDPLTGFYDQSFLNYRLNQCIELRQSQPASLALLQLKNFYEFRRWLGKSEAMLLLSDIAKILKKSLPDSVVLCRCQHYEFAALIIGKRSSQTQSIVAQICSAVNSAAKTSLAGKVQLEIGIGIAHLDARTSNSEVVFARARHDMCAIKAHASPVFDYREKESHALLSRLKYCLTSHKLNLSCQAIVSLKSGDLDHYELRVNAVDNFGVIPSELLFEVAVQNAWGEAIDRWLVKQAVTLLTNSKKKIRLTLSLTHNSIVSTAFFHWLKLYLSEQGIDYSQLVFQISEIDVLVAQHHMGYVCQQLNALDIALCINHFGCTDDPFRYLSLMRADYVKLDGALIEKTNVEQEDMRLLNELVEKLHENGLRVVIGKIESMAALPKLWHCNVNFVQGYCFHRPSSDLDFEFSPETALTLH